MVNTMESKDDYYTKNAIRRHYGRIASDTSNSCCQPDSNLVGQASETPADELIPSCCSDSNEQNLQQIAQILGYTADDVNDVPVESNLGLGCGNPVAYADLKEGETVLDLGSGAGFDCFLAAKMVGAKGKVIGVDMTPEMIARARKNAMSTGDTNIEFRLGEMEQLPIADDSIDVILSNCVVNLSQQKERVFKEAYRVLRAGGRLSISDIIARKPLPQQIRSDIGAIISCIGGAVTKSEIERTLQYAGFEDIRISVNEESQKMNCQCSGVNFLDEYIASATIIAKKPIKDNR